MLLPHDEAINRLEEISSVLRTDIDGTIILKTDGKAIKEASGEEFELAEKTADLEVIYIANKKSKVFHSEACPNLPSDKNRKDFSSREEAVHSGYKACGNCNP